MHRMAGTSGTSLHRLWRMFPGTERERGERRTSRFCIADQVVAPAVAGKVFFRVIDHVIKADGLHHRELQRAIDSGHFHVLALGELDGNCAHAATRPIDQDLLAGSQRSGRS